MTIGGPTLVLEHYEQVLDLILWSQNSDGATHGTCKRLVYMWFPTRFHFISRNGSIMFREHTGMISIKPMTEAEINRPGLRSDQPFTFNHRERSLGWIMFYGRSHLNDYLLQLNMANAKLTVKDETRELHRSTGILDIVDTLGEVWRGSDYDPSQVQSNQGGSRIVLL